MVYKKYIKRGDKLFGPYYYRSVKKDGKVITQYVKNPEDFPQKNSSVGFKKIHKSLLILPILFLILIAGFFLLKPALTGKVILSVDNLASLEESISGDLKLTLQSGEFIPAETKILINNEEFILKNLIQEESKLGEFYVSGTEISGFGEGYGSGNPEVSFEMNIFSSKDDSGEPSSKDTLSGHENLQAGDPAEPSPRDDPAGPSGEPYEKDKIIPKEEKEKNDEINKTIEEAQTEVINETETEKTTEVETILNEEIPIEQIPTETPLPEEEIPAESPAPTTGQIIFNFFNKLFLTITGKTSLETINEIQGKVSKDKPFVYALEQGQTAEIIGLDKNLNLEIINNTATITTDYSGEGAEYLINLSELNIPAGQNEFEIRLIYNDIELASIIKNIKIESNETNITEINAAENVTENLTEETIQHTAIAGKPVKWTKKVKVDGMETNVILPKEAENISVYKLENTITSELNNSNTNITDLNNSITGNLILSYEKNDAGFFNRLFAFITGRAVEIIEKPEEIEINISENAVSDYEVEYFTPGPEIIEKDISGGKEITISSELSFENVLASANLSGNFSLGEIKLYHKINGSTPDGVSSGEVKIPVDFIAYTEDNKIIEIGNDLDDDVINEIENILNTNETENRTLIYGEEIQEKKDYLVKKTRASDLEENFVSYIEWIVPHLSNQTYELILISKAEHLDENKTFIEDVYEQVKERDNNFTDEIPAEHYIRVTFEKNLTKENDITIYAKAGCNNTIKINEIDVPCDIYYKKLHLDSLRGENG